MRCAIWYRREYDRGLISRAYLTAWTSADLACHASGGTGECGRPWVTVSDAPRSLGQVIAQGVQALSAAGVSSSCLTACLSAPLLGVLTFV